MAITLFGESFQPADNSFNGTATLTVTPPASMQIGDLVFMGGYARTNSTTTIGVTGGQSRTTLTNLTSGTAQGMRCFWCVYNGTRSADPQVNFTGTTGNGTSVSMIVFRPSVTGSSWLVDNSMTQGNYTAGTTITITGVTTTQPSTVSIALRSARGNTSGTSPTWASLSGTGRSKTGLTAQYRNNGAAATSRQSQTYAYNIQTSAGATNDVSQTSSYSIQGMRGIISFYEIAPASNGNFLAFF